VKTAAPLFYCHSLPLEDNTVLEYFLKTKAGWRMIASFQPAFIQPNYLSRFDQVTNKLAACFLLLQ
jgi:hypothetical protein